MGWGDWELYNPHLISMIFETNKTHMAPWGWNIEFKFPLLETRKLEVSQSHVHTILATGREKMNTEKKKVHEMKWRLKRGEQQNFHSEWDEADCLWEDKQDVAASMLQFQRR
jgi:hypothetical protein